MTRKYPQNCCEKASAKTDHCSFCSINLCPDHAEEAEVQGHVFVSCINCKNALIARRPSFGEHCTCHDEEYCEHHSNVGALG